jgi:CheY-like chemotaxis protein
MVYTTQGSAQSILVIDDDEFSRAIIRGNLASLGLTHIQEANNGRAGVQALSQMQQPPDFLICDIFMPDMDGIEFVKELATRGYAGGLILVTGVNMDMLEVASQIATAKGLKVLGSFIKPVQKSLLAASMGFENNNSPGSFD